MANSIFILILKQVRLVGGFLSPQFIEQVRSANDIVEVISEHVLLKRQGREYVGLCPFHQEKTPSFFVSPEKQMFYCFGCQAGGDVIRFLMDSQRLTFPEAVERLAERAGLPLPVMEGETRELGQKTEGYELNQLAARYFSWRLERPEGQEARQYIVRRGLNQETVQKFALGYAGPEWDHLTRAFRKRGYDPRVLVKWGLSRTGSYTGQYLDLFRHRLIFPIFDTRGRIIAFGGRILGEGQPKYLNTPETPVFDKSSNLYGLFQAQQAIRDQNLAIVVEGYLDVLSLHQRGITNVVAPLGTALTEAHGKLLRRYTDRVVIAFDADPAGQKAALRSLDLLLGLGLEVRVLVLPDGKDPDEYLQKHTVEEFRELLATTLDLLDFKLKLCAESYDLSTLTGKRQTLQLIIPSLAATRDHLRREEYIRRLGQELNLSWETIESELRLFLRQRDKIVKNRHTIDNVSQNSPNHPILDGLTKAEWWLARLVVEYPHWWPRVQASLGEKPWRDEQLTRAMQVWQETGALPQSDVELGPVTARLLTLPVPLEQAEATLQDCIQTLVKGRLQREREEILKQIKAAEERRDFQTVKELASRLTRLQNNSSTLERGGA